MTSRSPGPEGSTSAYVWAWFPGALEPVVAGFISETTGNRLAGVSVVAVTYGRSYLERDDAISIFAPESPLRTGTFAPARPDQTAHLAGPDHGRAGRPTIGERAPVPLAGCLRDAAPDAWGRRVINMRLAQNPDVDLSEMTYLLESGSDRVGNLDFQQPPHTAPPSAAPAPKLSSPRATGN